LLNRAGRLLAVEPERRRAAVFESAGGAFGVCPLVFGVGVVTGPAG
jgi:hypothetical protein